MILDSGVFVIVLAMVSCSFNAYNSREGSRTMTWASSNNALSILPAQIFRLSNIPLLPLVPPY